MQIGTLSYVVNEETKPKQLHKKDSHPKINKFLSKISGKQGLYYDQDQDPEIIHGMQLGGIGAVSGLALGGPAGAAVGTGLGTYIGRGLHFRNKRKTK